MENSDQQTQILNLGKLFVKELGLEPGVDTFSKWMAHYIAEKMTVAEQLSPGADKKEAEKECFETILKLWEHRWSLPSGKRPLKEIEPILKTLERLNPEKQEPYFYHSLDHELSELEKDNPDLKEIMGYTNMALQIDKTARIWIDFVLHQAALKAKKEKTTTILTNATNLYDNEDVIAFRLILDSHASINLENYNEDDVQNKYRAEKLKKRIEELEKFSKLNEFLLENYKKEYKALG